MLITALVLLMLTEMDVTVAVAFRKIVVALATRQLN